MNEEQLKEMKECLTKIIRIGVVEMAMTDSETMNMKTSMAFKELGVEVGIEVALNMTSLQEQP